MYSCILAKKGDKNLGILFKAGKKQSQCLCVFTCHTIIEVYIKKNYVHNTLLSKDCVKLINPYEL
jgi:hypothetical protein